MVKQDTLNKLLQLNDSMKCAPLFFEELASLRSPKPNIDIERRRMSINARHNLKLNRHVAIEFFEALQDFGLGTLTVIKERSHGNSHFAWTAYESVIDVSKDVISKGVARGSCKKRDAASVKSLKSDLQTRDSVPSSSRDRVPTSNETPYQTRQDAQEGANRAPGSQEGETYICRLSTGQILKLTTHDMRELQEFIRSVL